MQLDNIHVLNRKIRDPTSIMNLIYGWVDWVDSFDRLASQLPCLDYSTVFFRQALNINTYYTFYY